jgi:acyl carrier protein
VINNALVNQDYTGGPLQTETEKKVSLLWAEILQRPVASSGDNFFELGGDSMMMMMVLFRVGEELGVELPQGVLVETPSLGQFCELIDRRRVAEG